MFYITIEAGRTRFQIDHVEETDTSYVAVTQDNSRPDANLFIDSGASDGAAVSAEIAEALEDRGATRDDGAHAIGLSFHGIAKVEHRDSAEGQTALLLRKGDGQKIGEITVI